MDPQLPKYIQAIVRRFSFLAIPNIGFLIIGLAVLAFVGKFAFNIPLDRFIFDPHRVLQGEWFRLFAFPAETTSPIFFLFFVWYTYFVMNALESAWGSACLTIFVIMGYLFAVIGALLTGQPISVWFLVLENVTLAFGTVFPNVELSIWGIIPVKAKWLAWLAAAFILRGFIAGGSAYKLCMLIALLPYFLFFGPILVKSIRDWKQVRSNRRRFDSDMWK